MSLLGGREEPRGGCSWTSKRTGPPWLPHVMGGQWHLGGWCQSIRLWGGRDGGNAAAGAFYTALPQIPPKGNLQRAVHPSPRPLEASNHSAGAKGFCRTRDMGVSLQVLVTLL